MQSILHLQFVVDEDHVPTTGKGILLQSADFKFLGQKANFPAVLTQACSRSKQGYQELLNIPGSKCFTQLPKCYERQRFVEFIHNFALVWVMRCR